MTKKKKLWGGRFSESTDAFVEVFTASVDFDKRLYRQDIAGSIAHATMLAHVGVLEKAEVDSIVSGLEKVQAEIESGHFTWRTDQEDVHMNIESRLIELIGDVGKKLHTGRSRNDQVATDLRLYLRDSIDALCLALRKFQGVLLDIAESEAESIMPGFTHLQVAQPVTFGHHMMAWFEMIDRDYDRLMDCRKRVNIMPLGSAALAGTSYPIDRSYSAKLLGFAAPANNSLDAVSDRDFAIEFSSAAALIMTHLSRFSEELVLWSSSQMDFIQLGDAFCTGSSIMPQKKNPDVPELVRGKAGRVTGHLVSLLMLMKAQPLAYNKDNQEDKQPVFDIVDTVTASITAYTGMMEDLQLNHENLLKAAADGFSTATDLADYLVRKGVPFRDAHETVGKLVRYGLDINKDLADMSLDELRKQSDVIDQDVFDVLTLSGSVLSRCHHGGTAPTTVRQAIKDARRHIVKD